MKWLGLRARIVLTLVLVVGAACAALTAATTQWARENRVRQLVQDMERSAWLDSDWVLAQVQRHPDARSITDLGTDRPTAGNEPSEAVLIPVESSRIDPRLAEQYVFTADAPLASRSPECLTPATVDDDQMAIGSTRVWSSTCGQNLVSYGLIAAPEGAAVPRWLVVRVLDPATTDDPVPALARTLATYSGYVLIVTLALAGILAAMVVGPLTKARKMAESVAAGRLDVRLPVEGHDEVAGMSAAVNTMTDRLTAQITDLEESGRTQRQFVSDVAHELRTPTAALLASAEALEHSETRERAALLVAPQLRRLASLTEDLLEISRIDAAQAQVQPSVVDLLELADEIIADSGSPHSVRLVGSFPVEVWTDPARLRVILRNLVANALQHGEPPVVISVDRADGQLRVAVTDVGGGVPPELRDRVFDRFVRGDASRHGASAGLGLAIATQNARLLGGTLALAEDGRTFQLTLPAAQRPPSEQRGGTQ